jgi:hypothetical protein
MAGGSGAPFAFALSANKAATEGSALPDPDAEVGAGRRLTVKAAGRPLSPSSESELASDPSPSSGTAFSLPLPFASVPQRQIHVRHEERLEVILGRHSHLIIPSWRFSAYFVS